MFPRVALGLFGVLCFVQGAGVLGIIAIAYAIVPALWEM